MRVFRSLVLNRDVAGPSPATATHTRISNKFASVFEDTVTGQPIRRLGSQAGYSLVELMTAVAIFGVLVSAALPHIDTRRQNINTAVKQAISDFRWARARAITSGQHFRVNLTAANEYQVERMREVGGSWELEEVVRTVTLPDNVILYNVYDPIEFNTRGMVIFPPEAAPQVQYLFAWDWKFSVEHAISIWPSGQIYEEW